MTTQTNAYPFNSLNNAAFIQNINRLAQAKMYFNRPLTKSLNIMQHFFNLSEQCLGKDYVYLQDAPSTRLYINDVFGTSALRFFEDRAGELILDIEHALLFYYWLRAKKSEKLPEAMGLIYFIAGHQLDDEFAKLTKVAPKNLITPVFELCSKQFRWKRCNFVLRKYMLSLSVNPNFKGYYYEMPNGNQISYLLSKGVALSDAQDQLNGMENGLFYTYLPKDVEEMMMPSILSGEFSPNQMDGYYTQSLMTDFKEVEETYQVSTIYNVYTQNVKPILIDMLGRMVRGIQDDVKQAGILTQSDFDFYHLSPCRVGVQIKEGYSLEQALPNLHEHMQEVKDFKFLDLLKGEHLY